MKKLGLVIFFMALAGLVNAQTTGSVVRYMSWGSYSNFVASMVETNVVIYPDTPLVNITVTNLTLVTVSNVTVSVTTNFNYYSSTNQQDYTIVTNPPWVETNQQSIAAAGGVTNSMHTTGLTMPIVNGTATVTLANSAYFLAPGNFTNVFLCTETLPVMEQCAFGIGVSNIGYGVGYTNSLTICTNSFAYAFVTNVTGMTSPSTVYWLIGGKGAGQTQCKVKKQ